MDPLLALNHFFNLITPAFVVALVVVGACQLFQRKRAKPFGWFTPVAINFAVGCAILIGGLWYFGNDGKIMTYGVLIVGITTSQWVILRSWKV